jgi:pyruvate dehydrogenase (quinone)
MSAYQNQMQSVRDMAKVVADQLAEILAVAGVKRIYGIVAADADAIFTCYVGLPTVWAARYPAMNGKRHLIGSFWHGSMANAMAEIGARMAFPGRQVISLSGDGGFTILMGDFLSLVQLGLPVKVVVFNNSALGFIEIEQNSSGFLDFGTGFKKKSNFAALAEASGVRGIRIEDAADVHKGIVDALTHSGPVLVDAVVSRMVLPIPPAVTIEMAKGFTLYMVRAVFNGRADDLVDLAESNLCA